LTPVVIIIPVNSMYIDNVKKVSWCIDVSSNYILFTCTNKMKRLDKWSNCTNSSTSFTAAKL